MEVELFLFQILHLLRNTVSDGTLVGSIISGLSEPDGVAVDSDGNIFAAERTDVKKYSADGTFISTIISGLSNTMAITIDNDGNIFVADYAAKKVYKIASN
ncbi:hypothetical protein [Clostridium beijerinckii]|uniref:hypothetical protein n=1 Tax=Clostridium beijerinckii TaxID=1520 RepID=UPI001570AE4E|nr:hypothetical protein [Clostridium beijerinckii]NRW69896.1 sugar lactone lactonase YvrE [Clostridium beijerinckii]